MKGVKGTGPKPVQVFEAESCHWCSLMMKMPLNLHSGAILEKYGNYKSKVLNRKLPFFHIFSIYYAHDCRADLHLRFFFKFHIFCVLQI